MIPAIVRFDSDSVDFHYEVQVDADRMVSVARDRNGVVYVHATTAGSYKQLRFLVTEETALAIASAITECLAAKPHAFSVWNKPMESLKDAISAFIEERRHDQS